MISYISKNVTKIQSWCLTVLHLFFLRVGKELLFVVIIAGSPRGASALEETHLLVTWQCQTNVQLLFWHFLKNLIETIYVQITLSKVPFLHLFQDIFGNKRDDLGRSCFSNLGLLSGSTEKYSPTLKIQQMEKHFSYYMP